MNWKFWKKAEPKDCRNWNEDWQVGDIAEVVRDGWHPSVLPWERLPLGARFTVRGFREGICRMGLTRNYYLNLAERSGCAYPTSYFRKVRPQAKEKSEIVKRILNAKPGKDNIREEA